MRWNRQRACVEAMLWRMLPMGANSEHTRRCVVVNNRPRIVWASSTPAGGAQPAEHSRALLVVVHVLAAIAGRRRMVVMCGESASLAWGVLLAAGGGLIPVGVPVLVGLTQHRSRTTSIAVASIYILWPLN